MVQASKLRIPARYFYCSQILHGCNRNCFVLYFKLTFRQNLGITHSVQTYLMRHYKQFFLLYD